MNPIILNNLPNILGFMALTLSVFTLIREVICWYFKINERVQLQKMLINEQIRTNVYLSHMSTLGHVDINEVK